MQFECILHIAVLVENSVQLLIPDLLNFFLNCLIKANLVLNLKGKFFFDLDMHKVFSNFRAAGEAVPE